MIPGPRLIVLHQMGSHGPAYYKRVPEAFKVLNRRVIPMPFKVVRVMRC